MRTVLLFGFAVSIVFCGLLVGAIAQAAETVTHAEINGTVIDTAGKPIQGATVRIWTAGARVGVNPYCPSCYLDCRKSAKSDAAGSFTIKSLDPTLVFRVLVVDKGYEAKFASVDPQKYKPMNVTLKGRPSLARRVDPRPLVGG